MADIKISSLEETSNLDGFYVPGVKETAGSLDSKKFGLGEFQNSIDKTINSVQGGVETFSSSKNYYVGEYVIYNNNVYRFIDTHSAGLWTGLDVTQVSVYSELENLMTAASETVHINVSKSGGSLDVSTVTVTLNLSNGTSLQQTCDASGNCSFTVTIGLSYTIVMPDQAYYQSIGNVTYTAEITNRYINIVYQETLTNQTCNITVNINPYNGGSPSDFNGYTCYLYRDNTALPAKTFTNGVATFTGLTKGVSYSTGIPTHSKYVKPADKTFIAYDNTGVNFSYKYISQDGFGIFLVYTVTVDGETEYREIELTALYENDTWIGESAYGITPSNAVAIHVYPETLANNGYDYFVKLSDLCNRTKKCWSSTAVGYPDVPSATAATLTSYYDGKLYTYYMAYDSRVRVGNTSPAADWVISRTFQYKGQTLHGFIGSPAQMDFIFTVNYNTNKVNIYKVLQSLGYTPTYATSSWWTCQQYDASHAHGWNSSSWLYNVTGNTKLSDKGVLPFFSI